MHQFNLWLVNFTDLLMTFDIVVLFSLVRGIFAALGLPIVLVSVHLYCLGHLSPVDYSLCLGKVPFWPLISR